MHGRKIQIFYANKKWTELSLTFTEPTEPTYCIELNPSFPHFAKEMKLIALEMEELEEESYDAERFLTSLLSLAWTPDTFKEIIGDTLYSSCCAILKIHERDLEPITEATTIALYTFVDENKAIAAKLTERLMVNLITLNAAT